MTSNDVFPSNFELLYLAYETLMDDEVLWILAQYCHYVWEVKMKTAHNYLVDVDKLRMHLVHKYAENQNTPNPLAFITVDVCQSKPNLEQWTFLNHY
jgi:hypothetical protein